MIEGVDDLQVVGEASDGLELLNLLKDSTADMVVLDISMPKVRGIEATREIKKMRPELKVLVLTMHKDRELLHSSIAAGADGYLLKEDTDRELFSAIERIRYGKIYVSPHLAEELTDDWAKACRGESRFIDERLTTREREVLKLIADGRSNKEIGSLLFISVRTVENHRAKLMRKLGMQKTADLVKYAVRKGYTLTT